MYTKFIPALLCIVVLQTGCAPAEAPPIPEVSLDEHLQEIYQRSCKNCHSNPAMGAPLAGDVARWQEIIGAGMDVVMARVMNGYQGMPPAGQCFECSPEQLETLVYYMASDKAAAQP